VENKMPLLMRYWFSLLLAGVSVTTNAEMLEIHKCPGVEEIQRTCNKSQCDYTAVGPSDSAWKGKVSKGGGTAITKFKDAYIRRADNKGSAFVTCSYEMEGNSKESASALRIWINFGQRLVEGVGEKGGEGDWRDETGKPGARSCSRSRDDCPFGLSRLSVVSPPAATAQ
jgi:hypothetical protein